MNGEIKMSFFRLLHVSKYKKRMAGHPSHTVLMIKTDSFTYETRGLSIWNGGLSENKTVVFGLLQKKTLHF